MQEKIIASNACQLEAHLLHISVCHRRSGPNPTTTIPTPGTSNYNDPAGVTSPCFLAYWPPPDEWLPGTCLRATLARRDEIRSRTTLRSKAITSHHPRQHIPTRSYPPFLSIHIKSITEWTDLTYMFCHPHLRKKTNTGGLYSSPAFGAGTHVQNERRKRKVIINCNKFQILSFQSRLSVSNFCRFVE